MEKRKPVNFKWSFENCKKEALKYNHRIDLKKNSKGAYPAAVKNKWLDEICSHMKPLGNKNKRLIYRYIFSDNNFYVGLTCNSEKRKKQHLTNYNSPVFNHIKNNNINPIYEELTEYLNIDESIKMEKYWFLKSIEGGLIPLNKNKTGALGSNDKIWSFENCKKEALKYNDITEFRKNSYAYRVSYNNGWVDIISSHMKSNFKPNGYWSFENCKKEALKYKTRYEFYLNSRGSYESARKNKWLNEICSHMKDIRKPKGYWTKDRCLSELKKIGDVKLIKKNNNYLYSKLLKYKIIKNNKIIWQNI